VNQPVLEAVNAKGPSPGVSKALLRSGNGTKVRGQLSGENVGSKAVGLTIMVKKTMKKNLCSESNQPFDGLERKNTIGGDEKTRAPRRVWGVGETETGLDQVCKGIGLEKGSTMPEKQKGDKVTIWKKGYRLADALNPG